jgi:hypothetical protein
MRFSVEIVPRGKDYAISETVIHDGRDPQAWLDDDVEAVLKEILRTIDKVVHGGSEDRAVFLRGFSWIVEPSGDQVVIVVEIGDGAAVAGPFDIPKARLDEMITRVVEATRSSTGGGAPTVH